MDIPILILFSLRCAAMCGCHMAEVLKPLLERRRRARINRCLDQMRDLMVDALSMEGDSAAKLEKADVLELAVRHLQKLQAQRRAAAPAAPAAPAASPQTELDRYRAGFSAAATVVPQFRTRVPVTAFPASPADSCSSGYSSGADSGLLTVVTPVSAAPRAPASSQCSPSPLNLKLGDEGMWRPW
ncbi:Enhancer of split mbeta protein [Amphibalanus amphitrite]|uniref:Enhancer of split mbeta protein n=1 Tax=Amphibalanus amphitrite TaxID=1232801 RepID=A0A6A4UYN4_AMPAM|nr:Enhancer of split mbeta protein [Amphibalanus amphitrite]